MATCKDCNLFNACSKWTDFPNQCGVPVCARFEEKSAWISVDERLPNEAERVLVYGENGFCFATRYKGDWLMPMIYPGELTHWMPLPEPPKGE